MNKRWLLLIVLVALAVLAWQSGWLEQLQLANLKQHQAELIFWRDANPGLASLLFFIFYVTVAALSLPGAAVMTLAAGALFGLWWGLLLVSFASTLGATLAMWVARYLVRDQVRHRFAQRMQTLDEGIRRDGPFYLFTLRLVPIFPFFVINLLLGLTAMPTRTFWWVSQLGMLPGTLVYVNAGTQLAQIDALSAIFSPGLIGAFVMLGLFPLLARKLADGVRTRRVYARWNRPARFDRNLVVIGAGSAGLVSAYIAATVKARVTLVERDRMGGDCLNTGCVPSKALIRASRVAHEVAHADRYGLRAEPPQVDFARVMARVQEVIRDIEPHDSIERYTELGVDVCQGRARLISPWEVEIEAADGSQQRLTTRSIIIASGARPRVPELPGLAATDYLTSDTLWQLTALPKRLLVLGGGPVGCELAQAFRRLGAEVTLVQRAAQLLPREDGDVAEVVLQRFQAEGIKVLLQTEAVRVDGHGTLIVRSEAGEQPLAFDRMLLALGRVANTDGLGLDALGIEPEPGRTLATDPFLATRFPNIFACGDVAGPWQFTHTASHQAWYAVVNGLLAPLKRFRVESRVIPWATFTDPEVARVGLSEAEARQQGIAYEVTRYALSDLDRAIADGRTAGFVKVLTPPGKDRILGVTLVGAQAGELIAEWVLAMKHNIGLNKLLGTIHIYPTLAEANRFTAGEWKRNHAPAWVFPWLARYHRWRRKEGT
ncbi:pyruvate/2-oxoglutarate dehydrogenase complex dihydrolipoamide dehydrogenase (E3) component [Marinobacterium halophilum]|uniref:Pyruvate/2-oxoglutarate dehydrogenase complex dihydrolipoamide dehydrogenase (E3) component n=1 Tax=Marinobacterium halophilum TaxID=267374 RepID=A0A2P8F4U2_9GAMM|nr:pyruvate/2-oxoglutarate dehydrogenase complex dihydrolipoamide dehydrogenase (E3) component [Marinobacterium halophilum]